MNDSITAQYSAEQYQALITFQAMLLMQAQLALAESSQRVHELAQQLAAEKAKAEARGAAGA